MSNLYTATMRRSAHIDKALRTRIADGTWPPGHGFSWPQLAEEFSLNSWDVSYILSPLLRKMRQDGLIESRAAVGMRVVIEGETWSPPGEYSDRPHDEYIETVLRKRLHDALEGNGIYRPGEKFSPVTDIAEEFGVSRSTVRKATSPLKKQGILVLVGNRRTYVAENLAEFSTEELLTISARRKPGVTKLQAFGESLTMTEWARHPCCEVDYKVLYARYASGWALERALTTPKTSRGLQRPRPRSPLMPAVEDAYTTARQVILSRISDNTYPPGIVIPVADVAISLEVPEEDVQDALRDLHDLGIVEHRAGVGYFTATPFEGTSGHG